MKEEKKTLTVKNESKCEEGKKILLIFLDFMTIFEFVRKDF